MILNWWCGFLSKMFPVNYYDYLNSSKWKRKRLGALHRANYRCQINANHTNNLHVHHNSYIRLGFERPHDLIVVCNNCHSTIHSTQMFPRKKEQGRKIVVNDAYTMEVEY